MTLQLFFGSPGLTRRCSGRADPQGVRSRRRSPVLTCGQLGARDITPTAGLGLFSAVGTAYAVSKAVDRQTRRNPRRRRSRKATGHER